MESIQYGNANKEVAVRNVTPTPEVSSTDDPYGIKATPSPSPSPVPKYTVSTLFGGNGTGSADGSVITAQIKTIDSMASDKSGNIYFIDSGKIRKYTKANKSVETYLTIDDRFTIEQDGKTLNSANFTPQVLCYDYYNNALLLAGRYRCDYDANGFPDRNYYNTLFMIYPTVKCITASLWDNTYTTTCIGMALTEEGVMLMQTDSDHRETALYRVTVGSSQLLLSSKKSQLPTPQTVRKQKNS